MESRVCRGCGAEFGCGRAGGAERCWCADLPQVMPVPDPDADCLCPECLRKEIARRPRLVSLLPAATDMVRALGADGRLVGVSHLCDAPPGVPRVLSSPIDSDAWDMSRIGEEVRRRLDAGEPLYVADEEGIAELRPDVILTQGLCPACAAGPETVRGVRVRPRLVTLSPHSLEDVARDLETVGEAAGLAEEGRRLARDFRDRIARARRSRTPRPRVTVVEWFAPPWASGEWIVEMIEAAGGEPALIRRGGGSRPVSWEELARAAPDVLVLAPCSMSVERAARELHFLEERPEWRALGAVRAGRVALMDGARHFSAPGPRLAEGVELLAEALDVLVDGRSPSTRLEPWFRPLSGSRA